MEVEAEATVGVNYAIEESAKPGESPSAGHKSLENDGTVDRSALPEEER